jgi:hypothetical protein
MSASALQERVPHVLAQGRMTTTVPLPCDIIEGASRFVSGICPSGSRVGCQFGVKPSNVQATADALIAAGRVSVGTSSVPSLNGDLSQRLAHFRLRINELPAKIAAFLDHLQLLVAALA